MQTIVYSGYVDPAVTALIRKPSYSANTRGGVFMRPDYVGTIARVVPTVRQTFHRVPAPSLTGADDALFAFFKDRLLPELVAGTAEDAGAPAAHTLLFVPSYFNYVRLRNLLDSKDLEFVTCR